MSVVKIVCFTGHRIDGLGGYDPLDSVVVWVRERLRGAIERAVNRGVGTFISGGDLGVGQWAADIVIGIKEERRKQSIHQWGGIKLVIARPFPSQPNRWPIEVRRHYEKILQKANRIVETSDDPPSARKLQMRNEWMVDNSDAVIAVWDGSSGGTGNTVEYAKANKKPVLVIDPVEKTERWLKE